MYLPAESFLLEATTRMTRRDHNLSIAIVLAAGALAALLLLASQAPTTRAATTGIGIGVLSVDGATSENATLPIGGTYYLSVATDTASSFVDARVMRNGTLFAQENRSLGASSQVSLPAGDYSIALAGKGRAALGWDFTNGTVQDFPDNETVMAFLVPSGARLQVYVSMGRARRIDLSVYDDALLQAGNATVTTSGPVDFVLPQLRSSIAYIAAKVTDGDPSGTFGLAWASAPLNPPSDFSTWPLFLLWILIPVALAFVLFVAAHRRRVRRGLGP